MSALRANQSEFHILAEVELFSDLSQKPEVLDFLQSHMSVKKFKKGETILEEGTFGEDLFILIQGQVSISKFTPEGDLFNVALLNEKGYPVFGEGGLIEAEPRSATITCDSECDCLVLKKSEFDEFCQLQPAAGLPIYQKITRLIFKRLQQTNKDLLLLHKALMDEVRS